jgi:Cu+-exporting ATPase
LVNVVSKYFTIIILAIAIISFLIWVSTDINLAFSAFTAVLIIACPCALALSTPFTLGNTLRIFGFRKLYVKNADVIELLAKVDTIVFDKTGTLTEAKGAEIEFIGEQLTEDEKSLILSSVINSSHPLSKSIAQHLRNFERINPDSFEEIFGSGINSKFGSNELKIGSAEFIDVDNNKSFSPLATKVYISFNGIVKGYFSFKNKYRENLSEMSEHLKENYHISVLSGDNSNEESNLKKIFGEDAELKFNQSPFDKLNHIKKIQSKNHKVLMIGDGLNDAGALKQSDVGISISEDINNFSPACDGIMESKSFNKLKDFIKFSRTSKKIIILSFIISFLYNLIGLFFAVQGLLSPVIAAILMPISSISVVVFTTLSTNFMAKKTGIALVEVIIVLIGASLLVAIGFLIAFLWAVKSGQYDDKFTPSVRILFDDNNKENQKPNERI